MMLLFVLMGLWMKIYIRTGRDSTKLSLDLEAAIRQVCYAKESAFLAAVRNYPIRWAVKLRGCYCELTVYIFVDGSSTSFDLEHVKYI